MSALARLLILLGIALVVVGLLLPWLANLGLGRLPGDIAIRRNGFQCYLPITTGLVISAVASLLLWLFRR